jgi:excisionase family DNA binding protein
VVAMNRATTTEKMSEVQALPKLAYSMDETARILGVSYMTVHRLLKRGQLRSSTALRHKLIPLSEIQRFLHVTVQ